MTRKIEALCLAGIVALQSACAHVPADRATFTQPELGLRERGAIAEGAYRFRDANGNGRLDAYEDWRLSPHERALDLSARMTLAEKAGMLMHATMPGEGGVLGRSDRYDMAELSRLVGDKYINSFITRLAIEPAAMAEQSNAAQAIAAGTRLGIPLTVSTDPRNHFSYVLGAAEAGQGTSQWPELMGFAALRDSETVRTFGRIARREYRALGIHMALSPQLDLYTEPRWPRSSGSFGSQADITSTLGAAYVESFQGSAEGLTLDGVITVVKHWTGYGAQPKGFEAHNYYGRFAVPRDQLPLHVDAFRGAIDAGAASVMPAYPILQETEWNNVPLEQVAPGFNRVLLKDVLRDELGFRGFLLSDWAVTRDCNERCMAPTDEAPQRPQDIGTPWGVEGLTVRARYVKGLEAGLDQFGGTDDVAPLLEAAEAGEISEDRLDLSVVRLLEAKFQLGLFENPYVDPARATSQIGRAEDNALADRAQREMQVLLRNEGGSLPFAAGAKVWLSGVSPDAATAAGLVVVGSPAQADFALVRAETPSEQLHPNHFFGSRYKEGRLDFRPGDAAFDALASADAAGIPAVLAIFLDRAAVLTEVQPMADVILANFGASDAAVIDVLLGRAVARGRLPFELPRSMAAVEHQDPARPDDSVDPLYPFGSGILLAD